MCLGNFNKRSSYIMFENINQVYGSMKRNVKTLSDIEFCKMMKECVESRQSAKVTSKSNKGQQNAK